MDIDCVNVNNTFQVTKMTSNLVDFLRTHQIKNQQLETTHTKIGSRSGKDIHYGGKYHIPEDELPEFYKHYYNAVIKNKKREFLTELQLRNKPLGECGPLLLDLDFEFKQTSMDTRIVNEDLYEDIIVLYSEYLCNYFDIQNNDKIPVWVLQKPNMKFKEDSIKDGLHIIFGIQVPHKIQCKIREDIMSKMKNLIDDEGTLLKNDIEDVLDKSISSGSTGWQLFGSRKPNHEAYELKAYYDIVFNFDDESLEIAIEENNVEEFLKKGPEVIHLLSARNNTHKYFPLKKQYEYDEEEVIVKDTVDKPLLTKITYNFDVEDIQNVEMLKKMNELVLKEDEYLYESSYKELYNCVMSLPEKYYNEYYWWIRVGWALKNSDDRLFLTWMEFSSQSEKFDINDIKKYYEMWDIQMKNKGLTERSIKYWLKQENPLRYKEIKNETIEHLMRQSVNDFNDYNIALVVFHLYKDEFRCPDLKNKVWYRYKNHRWVEINNGSSLRILISKNVSQLYSKKADEILTYATEQQSKQDIQQDMLDGMGGDNCSVAQTEATIEKTESYFNKLRKISQMYNKISNKLGNNSFKNNIMREVADLFAEEDPNFYNRLDSNPYLLCFNNGIYDFEEGLFRPGRPDDYVSKTTHIDYIPLDRETHKDTIEEILDFMEKLFPVKSLNTYMWEHLASTLIGYNKNQTFNIYNGCGQNGKTKLVELMKMTLGDYQGSVPITLVTGKRIGIGGTSSEIALLKGIRYAVMQEPSKNDKLNDGVMKELTGNDEITGRALFKEPVTFVPQFKLVVCTNNLFDINTNDDGTWRRIRLCEFMSKFIKDPEKEVNKDENKYYYFKRDKDIEKKFVEWKEIFMSMLVELATRTKGNVNDCDIVLKASDKYRSDQDYIKQFIDQNIVPYEEGSIRIKDLQSEYKMWCDMNTISIRKFPFKDVKEYMNKKYTLKHTYWLHCRLKQDVDDEIDEIN